MLDSEEFKLRREALLFSRLTGTAIDKLDQGQTGNEFHVSIPSREVPIFADRELILTSLVQLFDNAIKYSEPESPINITFVAGETEVVLTVRSKGLVVMPHDRERIFERFYRAPETHHLPAGTGLGLSIVKKIVEAHHGHVWAEVKPTTARRSLYLSRRHARVNHAFCERNILVTDDDPDLRRVLRRTLDALGFEVAGVSQREQALREVEGPPVPRGSFGRQTCRASEESKLAGQIRKRDPRLQDPDAHGSRSGSDKIEALDAGADDYITKPSPFRSSRRGCHPLSGAPPQPRSRQAYRS